MRPLAYATDYRINLLEPKGREGPVDLHGPSTAGPRAGRRIAQQDAKPPMVFRYNNGSNEPSFFLFLLCRGLEPERAWPS